MNDPLFRLSQNKVATIRHSMKRRRIGEQRFRWYGIISISFALIFLIFLLSAVLITGWSAFRSTEIRMTFIVPPGQNDESLSARKLIRQALRADFPEVTSRSERRQIYRILSTESEYIVRERLQALDREQGGRFTLWLPAGDRFNQYYKGELTRGLTTGFTEKEVDWLQHFIAEKRVRSVFNWWFLTNGDSRNPEVAGIAGALAGSLLTLLITLLLSFPIGVGAAIYLEEYAPKNRFTDFIEININNLAAVPSIIFGLLGLEIFLNVLGLPRSTPLVGGLVLTLMTLPTIIISSRSSLKAVPPSIRDGGLAMGASRTQVVFHHVVPLALPGMFTGSIIGMAQALGETAPLLMIGMVAFIVDVPQGFLEAATALPVQIFLLAENPERGFMELTSAAIIVLLVFLFLMNGTALYLRKRLEKRW
jgi:phosphate transport system permease protein